MYGIKSVMTLLERDIKDDDFGESISLSQYGNLLAIGAKGNDGNGNNSGHVQVYAWNGGSWVQLGSDIRGEAEGDGSGTSVSLSSSIKIEQLYNGVRLAIGATGNDGNGTNSGHVRVYEWNGFLWSQIGDDIDGEVSFDFPVSRFLYPVQAKELLLALRVALITSDQMADKLECMSGTMLHGCN